MKNIKVAICGISGCGKSTLCENLAKYNIKHIQGSHSLCKLGNIDKSELKSMNIESKNKLRLQFLEYLENIESSQIIIVDSHFCFPLDSKTLDSNNYDIAMEKKDFLLYDVILLLYEDSNIIKNRILKRDNKSISLQNIESWQDYELDNLEKNARKYNKIFSVINGHVEYVASFLHTLNDNFKQILNHNIESKIKILPQLVFNDFFNAHKSKILESKNIILSDLDGTLSLQDGVKEFYKIPQVSRYKIPNAFCNHRFYGFYQFFCLTKIRLEITESIFNEACKIAAKNIILNKNITYILDSSNALVIALSAGLRPVWNLKFIESKLDFLLAGLDRVSIISKETKGYFALKLKEMGFNIVAFGDGSVDIEMLQNANKAVIIESKAKLNIKNAIFISHNNSLKTLQSKLKGVIC